MGDHTSFTPLGTEESGHTDDVKEPLVKGEGDPVQSEPQRSLKPGSSLDDAKAPTRKLLVVSLLASAAAFLGVGAWKYSSFLEEETLNARHLPEGGVDGHSGPVKMWKEPHLDPWPLRPRVMRCLAEQDREQQKCVALTDPDLSGLHGDTCQEDDVYSSFAWFPKTGKLATYWYKQCMTVETIESVLRKRPDYCQDIQFNAKTNISTDLTGRRLRRNESKHEHVPPECLEPEEMVVPLKNGTAVWMKDCTPGDPWQEWKYDAKHKLFRNRASRTCLSLYDTVHMWECLPDAPSQWWEMEETWAERERLKHHLPPLPELPRDAEARSLFLPWVPFGAPEGPPECPSPHYTAIGQVLTYDPVLDLPRMSLPEQAHIESLQDFVVYWNATTSNHGLHIGGRDEWHRAVVLRSNHTCIVKGDVILAVNGRPAATGVHVRALMRGRDPLKLRVYRKTWKHERLQVLNAARKEEEQEWEEEKEEEHEGEEEEEDEEEQEAEKSISNSSSNSSQEDEKHKKHKKHKKKHKKIPKWNSPQRPGSSPDVPDGDPWEPLRNYLTLQMGNRSVYTMGNEEGILFQYNGDKQGKSITIASEMKLMGATLIMRLIELGYFGLDDRLSRWLPWWPTDPTDSRSYITIRHCIAMTSGFYWIPDDHYNVKMDGRPERFNANYTDGKYQVAEKRCHSQNEISCAQEVLRTSQHIAPPGVIWTYSCDHLRLVVAVMVTATGTDYNTLWRRHMFHRTSPRMTRTRHYLDMDYWDPAAEVRSTPKDLQSFLSAYYNNKLISPESQKILETESVREARVRWFLGGSRPARPHGMPNFAFDVWLSNPVMYEEQQGQAWCGKSQHCIFAPSYFNSVMAVERLDWPTYNNRNCTWNYSKSCSFYFHLQNVIEDASWENNKRCKYVSSVAEEAILAILQGKKWEAPPIRDKF